MEPMRALTVTSRLLPAKSMEPMTMRASSFRGVTAVTVSLASTSISMLGFTSRVITLSTTEPGLALPSAGRSLPRPLPRL